MKTRNKLGAGRHGGAITTRSPKTEFSALDLSSREATTTQSAVASRHGGSNALPERKRFYENKFIVGGADGREPIGEPRRRSVNKKFYKNYHLDYATN